MRFAVWPLALAATLLATPVATAAQRHAAPAGSGASCAPGAPCSLVTAVTGAGAGDEVILASGSYTLAQPLAPAVAIDLHGAAGGAAMPVVRATGIPTNGSAFSLAGGSTMRDVAVVELPLLSSFAIRMAGAVTLERVIASGAMTNGACGTDAPGATVKLIDTACVNTVGKIAVGLFPGGTNTASLDARGSTFVSQPAPMTSPIGLQLAGNPTASVTAKLVNTIVRGGAKDFECSSAGRSVTVSFTSYANTGTCTGAAFTDQGGRPAGAALLAPDGVHQLAGSPTIDTGTFDALLDPAVDVEGDLRAVMAGNDVGADEYTPAPEPTTGPPSSGAGGTAATLSGTVATGGAATDAHFELGTTAAYGTTTATQSLAPSRGGTAVATTLTGLTVGTTYHFRLVATSHAGTRASADATFVAAAPGAVGPPAVVPPTPKPAVAPRLQNVALSGGRVLFTLSAPARVTLRVERLRSGRRKGRTCSLTARRGKRCTRITTVLRTTVNGRQGAGRVTFARSALRRGRYRVTLRATAGGRSSAVVTKRFTVR